MAGLGTILKSASGVAAGLIFLVSVVFPPYEPHLLLARATAGYTMAAVSAAYLVAGGRVAFAVGAAASSAAFALSFIDVDVNMLLAPLSLFAYIALGWLYLLYVAWRLGRLPGLVLFFSLQITLSVLPGPSLQFANLLPSRWLILWGDRPEFTYFNWARYLTYCATTYLALYITKLIGAAQRRGQPARPPRH
ncbi:MAG: hypothetical protein QW680_05110 [Pyrobaculum sp.]|uniref:hypothetical protein n=2 Tax=Pyrobaculum sp. TaxID=2004705 RepID=UPI0031614DFA